LGTTLMALKDCARHLSLRKEHLEICLELAALGAREGMGMGMGTGGGVDAEAATAAALAAMTDAASSASASSSSPALLAAAAAVGGAVAAAAAGPEETSENVVVVPTAAAAGGGCGLARVLRCIAGFSAPHAVPGEPVRFSAGLRSSLPFMLAVRSVAVEFSDEVYGWRSDATDAANAATNTGSCPPPLPPSPLGTGAGTAGAAQGAGAARAAGGGGEGAAGGGTAPSVLVPNTWHCVSMCVNPVWGHVVEAMAVVVTLEAGISFRLLLGSSTAAAAAAAGGEGVTVAPPAADDVPSSSTPSLTSSPDYASPDAGERLPPALASVQLGVHGLDLRGAPPRLSLRVSLNGPAALGEACKLPLLVVSTGDAMAAAELVFHLREGTGTGLGTGTGERTVGRDTRTCVHRVDSWASRFEKNGPDLNFILVLPNRPTRLPVIILLSTPHFN